MGGNLRGPGLFVFISFSALAGPKSLAIASGDCRDPELLNGGTAFSDAIAQKLGSDALDPAQVLERLRPRPLVGIDDATRQLEAAQSQFYSGQNDKALEAVRQALKSLERIAPSDAVFKQIAVGRVLEGLVLKAQNKKAEQVEAWKRVLRVAPEFAPDPDYYTPATVAQIEALKKEMLKGKRLPLSVSSTPPGAGVYLDGALVGKTPLKGAFPEGTYRLTVAQGDVTSFVTELKLDRPQDVQIDLAFEGSLRPQLPLCVNAAPGNLESALKLAARAGADQALVLRVESYNSEPGWVASVLFEVQKGARVREGGMKVSAARKGSGYADLASFVLTGEPAKLSLAGGAQQPSWAPADSGGSSDAPLAPETVSAAAPSHTRGGRLVGGLVAGFGVVSALVGAALYTSGSGDRSQLPMYVDSNGAVRKTEYIPMANTLEARIQTNNGVSLGLAVAGAAIFAVGAILFFVLPSHDDAPQVSAIITPNGAFVGWSGVLP